MATQDEKIRFTFDTKDNTKKDFKSIAIGLVGITQAIQLAKQAAEAFKKAYDFGKQGAAAKRLAQAGNSLSDSYKEVVDTIQLASGETVDSMTAMSAANKALVLGVAKTPEEFEKLTKAAVALGRATGRTAAQSIEDLTTGIGRQSKLILDNLGIVYQADKVYKDYAKQLGKTADELTDTERKQALVNIAIEKANDLLDENGEIVKDSAAEYEILEANISDAKLEMQMIVDEAMLPAIKATNDIFAAQELLNNAVAIGAIEMKDWTRMMEEQRATGVDAYKALGKAIEEYEKDVISASEADSLFSNYLMEKPGLVDDVADAFMGLAEKELRVMQVEAIYAGDYALATAIGEKILVIEDQESALQDLIDILDELDGKTISYKVLSSVTTYARPSSGGGSGSGPKGLPSGGGKVADPQGDYLKEKYGYASGGSFTVPSGYPNDSYPMRVQSGEHVKVTPAGQSGNADVVAAIKELQSQMYIINQELVAANS